MQRCRFSKITYKIRTGKIVDEIVHESEEMDSDIIIMASSRITSYVSAWEYS